MDKNDIQNDPSFKDEVEDYIREKLAEGNSLELFMPG